MRPRRTTNRSRSTPRSHGPRRSGRSTSAAASATAYSRGLRRLQAAPLVTDSRDPLDTPLQFLKGVGPRKGADLKKAGLATVEDLLYRLPFRYEDRSRMQPIASLRPGNKAAILGEIKSANLATTRRRGFRIFHAVIGDQGGAVRCTWMTQAYLAD